jgi:hypothetical protein
MVTDDTVGTMNDPTRRDDAPADMVPADIMPTDMVPADDAPADVVPAEPLTFEPTGDDEIDAALVSLRTMADLPAHEHAAVVERVHRVLQDRLADGQE